MKVKPVKNNDYGVDVSTIKRDWIVILVIVLCFITGIVVLPHLPDRVPLHWNLKGEVDRYGSPLVGAFGIPSMLAVIYLLMLVLPLIDPKSRNYALFAGVYNMFKLVFALFMAGLYFMVIAAALGYDIDIGTVVSIGISLLFILLGNSMGRIKHNYFFGVKNPWTLADEEVWKKTHRLAGRVFVAGGAATLVTTLISRPAAFWALIASIIAVLVITSVYSYTLFKSKKSG